MKKIFTTALATFVAFYGYSQAYLPLTGGNLTGPLTGTTANFALLTTPSINIRPSAGGSGYIEFTEDGIADRWAIGISTNDGNFHWRVPYSNSTSVMNLGNTGNLTLAGSLTGTTATYREDGNSPLWKGKVHSANATTDRQVFLGTYGNVAAIASHNYALNAWTDLYVNTINGTDGGVVRFGNTLYGTSASFNGNLGIGTPAPTAALHIKGNGKEIFVQDDNVNTAVIGGWDGTSQYLKSINLGVSLTPLTIQASRVTLDGGNVGIGTSSPQNLLHVQNNTIGSNIARFASGGTRGVTIYSNDNYVKLQVSDNAGNIGSWANLTLNPDGGNVGIGTTNLKGYKLAVAGNVIAESVIVALQGQWPDYVFKAENKLLSLKEVEQYVQANSHLPEMPSEAEVRKEGIDLGQMDAKLLKKIEELTLHLIQQNKRIEELERLLIK